MSEQCGFYKVGGFFKPLCMAIVLISSCKSAPVMQNNEVYAFRLTPGMDLKKSIDSFVTRRQIKAGWINTCVGSLTTYNIRFANQPGTDTASGHFEIVSLTGTVSVNGSHLHISVSDSTGRTIGGHLSENNIVYTTAEIVIGSAGNLEFKREHDGTTPWDELQVREL
jgi:hypothetical protein